MISNIEFQKVVDYSKTSFAMKCVERKSSKEKMQLELDCDEILHQIGGTGLWQILNFLLLCLPTMASGFLVLSFVFTGKYFDILLKL